MQSLQIKQILFLILILFAFLFIFGFLVYTSTANANMNESSLSLKRKLIQYKDDDITIDSDEVIDGDIVIENGSISVAGEIHGNIIAFNTDIQLESSAYVFGHIISYNKEITQEESARVAGHIARFVDGKWEISEGRNFPTSNFSLNTFESDATIEQDETISGDILVLNCKMTISGKVDGCVINILGKTNITEDAAIDGNVISYEGRMLIDDEALITGRSLELESEQEVIAVKGIDKQDRKIQADIERKYLKRDREKNTDIFRFMGDITIEPDEVIRGDVVTLRGTITVKGEVDGDVVAVFGSVELDSTAYVDGDVVSVGGKIFKEEGAYIEGDIVQTSLTGVKVDDGEQRVTAGITGVSIKDSDEDDWVPRKRKYKGRWRQSYGFDDDAFMFRHNRVEGLFLGLRLRGPEWRDHDFPLFNLYGHAGYGFSRKRGCYQLGIDRSIFGNYGPIIGVETHDVVESEDVWIIPTFENSLAALFLKEDFQDYYRREGYSGYISHDISEYLNVKGEFRKDHIYGLEKRTNWSIFGGKKTFRENPVTENMDYKSIVGNITLDTRNSYKYPDQGWLINVVGEFARRQLNKNNDVDFDRFIIDIRRYQPITYGENLDFRLRGGTSRGTLPLHLKFDLGGISTLRGYNFKEFEDYNRMLLGNVEYRIHGRTNPLNAALGMSDISLILFADAGYLWSVSDTLDAEKGFEELDWKFFKTSLGFALSNRDGNVRLNFAKCMDEKGKPFVITFRINRPF